VLWNQPALMIPYLGNRVFEELHGAPELNGDGGDFVISPDRPEWHGWLADVRRRYGEAGVQSIVRGGVYRGKTRWPQGDGGSVRKPVVPSWRLIPDAQLSYNEFSDYAIDADVNLKVVPGLVVSGLLIADDGLYHLSAPPRLSMRSSRY
jgi:hypothetical protein